MNTLLERFIRYVKIDTMSDDSKNITPSTLTQFDLAYLLKKELEELGLEDITLNNECILHASLKANYDTNLTIAFFSHLDTIPDYSGKNVIPHVIYNYDGEDIVLKDKTISSTIFPELKKLKGKTIITSEGLTVLGADDKAGIAIILDMLSYLKDNPNYKHVNIKVCFTPDEEIGGGLDNFDPSILKADYAYTIDGGLFNEINYENFNAASAKVTLIGRDVHPGDAKEKMLNATLLGMEFHNMLHVNKNPMYTSNYEGFNHLTDIKGNVTKCELDYILRDHDINKLNNEIDLFNNIKAFLNNKYQKEVCSIEFKDSYKNMYDIIKNDLRSVNKAIKAIESLGYKAISSPIRGGTDGAKLTYKGLNTPNLGTGGYNCHGPYEFACLEEMNIVKNILLEIIK